MIARPYLRTPKAVIIQTTSLARRKRHEFVRAVAQGLIPPETPPLQRKSRKRRYLDVSFSINNCKMGCKAVFCVFRRSFHRLAPGCETVNGLSTTRRMRKMRLRSRVFCSRRRARRIISAGSGATITIVEVSIVFHWYWFAICYDKWDAIIHKLLFNHWYA